MRGARRLAIAALNAIEAQIARHTKFKTYSDLRHSGAMRSIEPQMCNCTSGNLEIPVLVLRTIPE
jgi:hypothetical protein